MNDSRSSRGGLGCASAARRGRLRTVRPARGRACTMPPSLPDPQCFGDSTPRGGGRSSPPAHRSRQGGRPPHPRPDGVRVCPSPAHRCKRGSSLRRRSGSACHAFALTLVSEPPDGGEDVLEGDLLGEHLGGTSPKHLLVGSGILQGGHHQHRDGGVGLLQMPDHLRGALVGEGYVHYGGIYAALGHPPAPLGHRAALSNYLKVRLLVHHVGGGLTERAVILHKQDERHLLAPVLLALALTGLCTHKVSRGHLRSRACCRTYE